MSRERSARRALIFEGGSTPHVIAAARALAAGGWTVGVASSGPSSAAARSRHVRAVHRVPAPEHDLPAFVAAAAEVTRRGSYQVVFGADDVEVVALSFAREQIPAVVPYAEHHAVLRAIDKLELHRAAVAVGLGAPDTRPVTPELLAACRLPVVVKARLHWQPGVSETARHQIARLCATRAEAKQCAEAMRDAGGEPLLQDVVDGELMALTTVADRGSRPVGFVQQRGLRLSLRHTTCRGISVPVEEDLAARASALLARLGWFGMANMQFLRSPAGAPLLIDFNGRFYGSLALASAAGMNLPAAWADLATGGGRPSGAAQAAAGARFQSLAEDLRRARSERRGGLARDVAGALRFAPGAAHPHLAARDPGPALALLARLVPGGGTVSQGGVRRARSATLGRRPIQRSDLPGRDANTGS